MGEIFYIIRRLHLMAVLALMMTGADQILAETHSFNIESGNAETTLRQFAKQARVSIVMDRSSVRGVQTNEVSGLLETKTALEQMLAGTNLTFKEDLESGAFAVTQSTVSIAGSTKYGSEIQSSESEYETQNIKPMNENTKIISGLFKGLLAIGAVGASNLSAQDETNDKLYELSPFTVSASEDTGYRATTTLAGTRIKSDIGDLGASISVLTGEFFEDTASTDLEDALVYTGAEVNGPGGNFSGLTPSGTFVDFNDVSSQLTSRTRVRGLASANQTRDFFDTNIPFDSYNSERITIQRGPNSTLFGQGSAGGIIDASTKKAIFSDQTEIGLRIGEWGSYRGVLDVNRVVSEGKLAFRFIGLYEDESFEQRQAFLEDSRYFGAVTYTPFEKSTFRASYERVDIDANKPRIDPPRDHITRWFEDPAQNSPKAEHTNVDWNDRVRPDQFVAPGEWFSNPALIFTDPNDSSALDPLRAGQVQRTERDDNIFFRFAGQSSARVYNQRNSDKYPFADFYFDDQIIDRSIFDYRTTLLDGPNKSERMGADRYTISFEQLFLEDKAGFEITFAGERVEQNLFRALNSRRSYGINIDVNRVHFDGSPNENFGRPFIAGNGLAKEYTNENEDMRFTAFGRFDFRDHMGSDRWSDILGSHSITGFFTKNERRAQNFGFESGRFAGSDVDGISLGDLNNGNRRLTYFNYLGPSLKDAASAENTELSGIGAELIIPVVADAYWWHQPTQAWVNADFDLYSYERNRDKVYNQGSSNLTRSEGEAYAFILQSKMFSNNVISTIGYRRDESEQFRLDNPVLDTFRILGDPFQTAAREMWNWSAVIKTPQMIKQHLPDSMDFSIHYNENENFVPQAQRINIFGEGVDPPTGATKDYGFSLELFDGKFTARMNWYEIVSANADAGLTGTMSRILTHHRGVLEADRAGVNSMEPWSIGRANYVSPPDFLLELANFVVPPIGEGSIDFETPAGWIATTDTVSEGIEADFIYNPTKNWRVMFNVTQQEAQRENTAPKLSEVILPLIENWTGPAATTSTSTEVNFSNNLGTDTVRQMKVPFETMLAQDGGPVHELREWRWNLITNYQFDESGPGWLNGVNVGSAARWEDDVAIGFPIIEDPDLGEIRDIGNPFMSGEEFKLDFWVGYKTKIMDDSVDWTLQLNIRNLLDEDELVPVATQPDGSIAAYRIPEPRVWSITSTFKF